MYSQIINYCAAAVPIAEDQPTKVYVVSKWKAIMSNNIHNVGQKKCIRSPQSRQPVGT